VELPRLKDLYSRYNEEGLEIVAIDRANDRIRADNFIRENELPFIFLDNGTGDEDELVASVFVNRVFPTSYFIDDEGYIRYVHIGFEEGDEDLFEEELKEIMSE